MRRLTQQLRASYPNAGQLRIRRALSKKGDRIFQLLGVLPGGQRIARKLDAEDEVAALVAAQQMMSTVGDAGLVNEGRITPQGQLKVIQRMALQAVETRRSIRSGTRKPITQATKRYLRNAVMDCISHLQEAGLVCNAGTLRTWAIKVDEVKRERRRRLEAVRLVAAAANLSVETKDISYVEQKAPERLSLLDFDETDKELDLYQILQRVDNQLSDDSAWAIHVIATLGIRATGLFSIRPPDVGWDGTSELRAGDAIPYWDTKRSRPAQATPTLEFPLTWHRNRFEERNSRGWAIGRGERVILSEFPQAFLDLRGPIDRDPPQELAAAQRRKIDAVSSEVVRKMSSLARFLGFRQLRHLAITRILKQGVPPMMAAELTATSREMLDQTYGHLYKSEAVAASQALLKAAEVF